MGSSGCLLLFLISRVGAAGVPPGCTGWPGHTALTDTNYSNADLPPLLEFVNGEDEHR